MSITWILVADASRARVLRLNSNESAPKVVDERHHPASRAKASDLVAGDRGRTQPRNRNDPRGAAMAYSTPPKEVEAEAFAREITDHLRLALARNEYDHLVLVAPPEFLGVLRALLDGPVSKSVTTSVAKDYTRERPEDVLRRIGS